ncbi:MAG TPA: thioredoxin domain-containing protein [Burkholderiales bacterium]|nr:thioredoxin domain-containing protein [Burkholderiales bacterium]
MPALSVTCLCAEWCDTCREYRTAFYGLAERFPEAQFNWLDIEYDAEEVGDVDVENFPTLRIERGGEVLFHGVLQPRAEHLAQLLERLVSR